MGGAIFNFLQKIGLKSTKNVRFCILHKPMGGLEPPRPPGYATDCYEGFLFQKKQSFCRKNSAALGMATVVNYQCDVIFKDLWQLR